MRRRIWLPKAVCRIRGMNHAKEDGQGIRQATEAIRTEMLKRVV
jgi:hypothetical protein